MTTNRLNEIRALQALPVLTRKRKGILMQISDAEQTLKALLESYHTEKAVIYLKKSNQVGASRYSWKLASFTFS